MTASNNANQCSCDPLKLTVQQFFRKGLLQGDDGSLEEDDRAGETTKLHMFYKSSVLRFPGTRGGKLECKVKEESLASLKEWAKIRKDRREAVAEGRDWIFKLDQARNLKDPMVKSVMVDEKAGNVTLELDKTRMKIEVIRWLVTTGWSGYSRNPCHNQVYRVEIMMARVRSSVMSEEKTGESSFLEYRRLLVAQAVSTLLKKVGHRVDDSHFTSTSSSVSMDSNHGKVLPNNTILVAGFPIDRQEEKEDVPIPESVLRVYIGCVAAEPCGVQDMLSKRLEDIKGISEARRLESLVLSSWATSLDNLTRATLHYDLLHRPLEADIQMVALSESAQMNNGALFIMYNYSRVLSILRKFGEQIGNGDYPKLPTVTEVDFTRICEREEELRLVQLLMEWPRIMESTVNFVRFQLNLNIISKYLLALAKAFNSFYFQIVVLVPTTASHNFPTMMARIYLIKAICRVFEDCLDILQVNHSNSTLLPEQLNPTILGR